MDATAPAHTGAEPRDVVGDFFLEASEAVVRMADKAGDLATRFRGHDLQHAHEALVQLTEELREFPTMIKVLRGPLAVPGEQLAVLGAPVDQQLDDLAGWLTALVEAHGSSDWLVVADVMELDLQPLLRAWGPVLQACYRRHAAARG